MSRAHRPPKALATALAVALVLGLVGVGVAEVDPSNAGHITTGHTTFFDVGMTYNKCFAGIAGALMQRVTWFNGATLFSRMSDGGGNTFMYAMEQLPPETRFDPSEETLYETGKEWVLQDKNRQNVEWQVKEYYALLTDPMSAGGTPSDGFSTGQEKYYVYTVEVGPAITDTTVGKDYNFVMVVDTCKFTHQSGTTVNHSEPGTDPSQPSGQHDNDTFESHEHEEFRVALWVGGKPQAIPLPADATNQTEMNGGGSSS